MGTRMRLATLPTQPTMNENHRLVRTVFKRADLLASSVLAVEQSMYFPSGKSPVHAEDDSEEVIYFRRGRGKVLRGNEYVEVGPGSAVTIPGGKPHHVVNTGEDVLEHILISADLSPSVPKEVQALPDTGDFLVTHGEGGLRRLACRKFTVAPGETSRTVTFGDRETVYAISGGFAIVHVALPGGEYEWQYAMDASNCFWLPPDRPHYFRNVGDSPLAVTSFLCLSGSTDS
ncbi:MAG: cupin domain-containing protein [Rhizobiaceae bacterium]